MNWRVPLFDPELCQEEEQALRAVLRSKWLTMGERTVDFEKAFAAFIRVPHTVATSSCTAALHLALMALDIGPGDQVICPSLTFVATANSIRYCGATPVFADVASLDEWNINRRTIETVLTPSTRALVVVHYGGYPCDMASIMALARERGLAVVEDVAHAPGASRDGTACGAWGDIGCFSFFSNKNMTTGEGGMITTGREDLAARIRLMRSHGMTTQTLDRHKGHAFSYDVVELGYNYRMSELNAALGLVQLKHLTERNLARAALVARYKEQLVDVPGLGVPFTEPNGEPVWHIMPVLLPKDADRAVVMAILREAGVQSSIHYRPIDTFSAYVEEGLGPAEHLVHTHAIGHRVLTLPLYPSLDITHVDHVCDVLRDALAD